MKISTQLKNTVNTIPTIAVAGIVNPIEQVDYNTVINASTYSNFLTSTFSGWGQYLGNITQPFNTIQFYFVPFNPSYVCTGVRCRIRKMPDNQISWSNSNPSQWEIVGDTTIYDDGTFVYGTPKLLTVKFEESASFSGNLFFEYFTDGKTGIRTNLTISVDRPPRLYYTTDSTLNTSQNWTQVSVGADQNFYCTLGLTNPSVLSGSKFVLTDTMKTNMYGPIDISLPPTIYAVEGQELNVYFDNVLSAPFPLNFYSINITCPKGTQYERKWTYNPQSSDSGTVLFTLDVKTKDTNLTIASYTSSLVTSGVADPTYPVTRSVLIIGDSTGAWPLGELTSLFSNDVKYKLNLVGSNSGSLPDASGELHQIKCECISGWSHDLFFSNTSMAWTSISGEARIGSPFVSSSVFKAGYYTASYGINLHSNDWVIFNLGINDIFSYTNDTELFNSFQSIGYKLEKMIDSFTATIPGIRIGVSLIIPPNISQDAFGVNYGTGQTRDRYKRNRDLYIRKIIDRYKNQSYSSSVYLVPLNYNLDSVYNFPSQSVQVNSRNSNTHIQSCNGVHPEMPGYLQIADSYRMFLKNMG